jgi:hypothetical protein
VELIKTQKEGIPQQLSIGVSGDIQITTIGLAMKYEEAVGRHYLVIGAIDIANAHNALPQSPAFVTLIDMAREDETLIPLVVAMQAALWAHNDIYMRSRIDKSGYTQLCQVKSGGGQGNGLTGVIFACTINRAVKDTEARFPGVEIKCIHDDMTLLGPAVACFETANQEGGADVSYTAIDGPRIDDQRGQVPVLSDSR